MRSRRLGVLVCRLIVGVDEFFAAVVDDGDSQDHEGDGQDELQAFDEERPVARSDLNDQADSTRAVMVTQNMTTIGT